MILYDNVEESLHELSNKTGIPMSDIKTMGMYLKRKYNRPFLIRETEEETLLEWSKFLK